MFHVEFLGPSGVGKSTVSAEVAERIPGSIHGRSGFHKCVGRTHPLGRLASKLPAALSDQVLNQYWQWYQRKHNMCRCLVEHPQLGARMTDLLLAARAEIGLFESIDQESLLSHVHEEMATYQLYSTYADDHETVLIDDGLFQFFLFLLIGDESFPPADLVESLPQPDVLVVVDAPPEVCFERQESRSKGRIGPFVGLDDQRVTKFIEKMRSSIDRLADASSQQDIRIIRVTNTDGIATTVDTVADEIVAHLPKEHK